MACRANYCSHGGPNAPTHFAQPYATEWQPKAPRDAGMEEGIEGEGWREGGGSTEGCAASTTSTAPTTASAPSASTTRTTNLLTEAVGAVAALMEGASRAMHAQSLSPIPRPSASARTKPGPGPSPAPDPDPTPGPGPGSSALGINISVSDSRVPFDGVVGSLSVSPPPVCSTHRQPMRSSRLLLLSVRVCRLSLWVSGSAPSRMRTLTSAGSLPLA